MRSSLILLAILFSSLNSFGQELEREEYKKYRIAFATINSVVPAIDGDNRVIIPAWGLEFEYRFTREWAVLANFEYELMNYVVVKDGNELVEREFPLITSVLLLKDFNERFILGLGYGIEHEPNEDFSLIIFNANYLIKLPDNWDITPGFTYNSRINAFDTYSLNIAFGKSF